MARPVNTQSISSIIEEAARPVLARLSRDIAKTIEAASTRMADAAWRRRQRPGNKRSRRPRGEMTKWVADRNARRVPKFVIEMTGGLDTKKKIVRKYGEDAAFERGKPLPKEAGTSVRPTGKDAARTVKAKPPVVSKAAASSK